MAKFKVWTETRQSWSMEVEAKDIEQAKEVQEKMYHVVQQFIQDSFEQIQDTMFMTEVSKNDTFSLEDTWGDDSEKDIERLDDAELPEQCAKVKVQESVVVGCPHCHVDLELHNIDKIREEINSKGYAVVTCGVCGKKFRITNIVR